MIGWYEARTSLLSYVVATSRRESDSDVWCLSVESVAGAWEENYPSIPAAVPCGPVLLPHAPRGRGKEHRSGLKVCTQLHPFPYNCAQRGRGLKEPCEDLCASLSGEVSSKLRTLAAASCAACQNLLWGWSQTNFVEQWGSLSEHRYSFTLSPGSTKVPKSCSSSTYLVEPQWRKWLWLRWCNTMRMGESTRSIYSWGNQCNWKKTLILKGIMVKHFFTSLGDWL